ncbi:MAG TPA: HD-GYP domain-containing protein [Dehalococcoidales bacterium]|nr:HD-GYP domain-containing protein [Dehalococcoidales bacterium]
MSAQLILSITGCLINLALIGIILTKNRRHHTFIPCLVFLGLVTLGTFFISLSSLPGSGTLIVTWQNLAYMTYLGGTLAFYWLTISLTGTSLSKKVFAILAVFCLAVSALIPSGLVFNGMQSIWYGNIPQIGPFFPLYLAGLYLPLLLGLLAILINSKRTLNNEDRSRNQYIMAGVIAFLIGNVSDYLPALGIPIYPLGLIGNILFCLLIAMPILKYELTEFRAVMRTGAAYSLVSVLVFGLLGSAILMINALVPNTASPLAVTLSVTVVFLIAAIFQPLLLSLQRWVDRWFFKERYHYLQAIKKLAQDKEGDLNINQLSVTLVNTLAQGLQSSGVYLLLPSAVTREYITQAYSGQKKNGGMAFSFASPLAMTLKYQDKLVDSQNMEILPSQNDLAEKDRRTLADNNIELVVPFKKDDSLVGILFLARKLTRESYSNEDKQLLKTISAPIAVRIDNALRFETVIKTNTELQKTMEGIILAISAVVESRDPYTAGHQRRVAELARAIGAEMGFSDFQQKGLRIMGMLHDVGKTAIPAEILSKPGKISQFEFNIIKTHSFIGNDILEKIEFPWPVARAVVQHHERLDGSGYPHGLRQNDIILEARILAVADVVEAMSSHRPHRPALGLPAALKEIQQKSGLQYDRMVVDACLRLLNGGRFAFEAPQPSAKKAENLVVG